MQTRTFGIRWLLFLLLVLLPVPVLALNINSTSMNGIARAYGFVLGQEYSLSRIEKEFPELTMNVELARAQFGATFPNIKTKLEKQLKNAMGKKAFLEEATKLHTKLSETLGNWQITRDIAANFLNLVKDRSKGEIESPVLEYLLAVKYESNPVGEFADGFRQRYQTDGSGKSQGIKLNMQLPRSWAAKEGERPNIVQKWVSENGTGLEIALITIKPLPLPAGTIISENELKEIFSLTEMKKMVPPGARFIRAKPTKIEGLPAGILEYAMRQERAGLTLDGQSIIYNFIYGTAVIQLQCIVTSQPTTPAALARYMEKFKPLFSQIANSIVLPDKWR